MAKRKHDDESSSGIYDNKSRARQTVEARVDPTYGQRSALPGLDDDTLVEDEDLNYCEEMDALAYLRSVRQEATSIPNLLVASAIPPSTNNRDIYEDGVGDFRGRYEDGAYFVSARDDSKTSVSSNNTEEHNSQLAYFDSILARYESLRSNLQQLPPPKTVEQLGKDYPIYLGPLNKATAKWWLWKMRTSDPRSAQIASMDKSTILRLLGLITQGSTLKRGSEITVGISTWVWSLLARLPARGELTSEEIGVVRELGKKAVLVGMGLQKAQLWEKGIQEVEASYDSDVHEEEEEEELVDYVNDEEIMLDDVEDTNEEGEVQPTSSTIRSDNMRTQDTSDRNTSEAIIVKEDSSEFNSLAAIKAKLLARIHDREPKVNLEPEILAPEPTSTQEHPGQELSKWNTKATVDVIITIAGEVYGQRDLLEFRGSWNQLV